jgi:hypothetical protein
MYPLKHARKAHLTGLIHHEIEGQEDRTYRTLRAGLVWPNKSAPAYFCILGQLDRENASKRNPIVFLCEGQSKELHPLFDKLTDQAKSLICEEVFTDFTEDRKCFRDSFASYCEETGVRGLYLNQAPWPENFAYGLSLIRDWIAKNSLKIEQDTLLASQLGKISEDLLEDIAKAEVDFFAVNALRYVLGAFQKYPHRPPMNDIDYGPVENYPGYYRGIDI